MTMDYIKAFITISKNTWNEYMEYRLNFVLWRFRLTLKILIMYFLWWTIFSISKEVFGYSQTRILTYVLFSSIVSSIVFSTRTQDIGSEINQGNLSNLLLKPFNVFYYWIARDIGDKSLNIIFSIFEISLLIVLLKPPIFMQTNFLILMLTALGIAVGLLIYFFISLILSFIGFWSPEIWGPRFVLFIIIDFFAGGLFPLDILPGLLYRILELFPFTYLVYFPIKIYLGQLVFMEILKGLVIGLIWVFVLSIITKKIWLKGLSVYEAYGR